MVHKPIIIIFIVSCIINTSAMACDSYDNCMIRSNPENMGLRLTKCNPVCVESIPINARDVQTNALRAIAYKLDEISKKLDVANMIEEYWKIAHPEWYKNSD